MAATVHALKDASVVFDLEDAEAEKDVPGTRVQVSESRLNERQRAAAAEATRMIATVIHDNGGETRAANRLDRKTSFVRARVEGRMPWRFGDVLAALGPDELDDLGKALRTRAATLRGVAAGTMSLVARMRRVHQETSEATAALMALVAADAPGPRALADVARELRESIREQEAALADVEARLAAMGATR